jgi:hypothetical protein
MSRFLNSVAIVIIIIIVAIAIYFVVFKKYPGNNLTNPTGQDNPCVYDADCPADPTTGIATHCVSGKCSAYCIQDSDCWYGNTGNQSATCVSNPAGQRFCTLRSCTTEADCNKDGIVGEACVSSSQSGGTSYCYPLGTDPSASKPQSVPCSGSSDCFGNSGLQCNKTTGSTWTPQWGVPCIFNTSCTANIPCSNGCTPGSVANGLDSSCPGGTLAEQQAAWAAASKTPYSTVCGQDASQLANGPGMKLSGWPVDNTGYCVQCLSGTDCTTLGIGSTCTNNICVA